MLISVAAPLGRTAAQSTDEVRSYAQLMRKKAMEVMHMMDADKKGYVTREEFVKFQEQFFDRMDKNHDGKVDAKEWMGKAGTKK
jgi:Ca2+-binding EF-hand superfamily protein